MGNDDTMAFVDESGDATVGKLLQSVFEDAVQMRASDIHSRPTSPLCNSGHGTPEPIETHVAACPVGLTVGAHCGRPSTRGRSLIGCTIFATFAIRRAGLRRRRC